MLFDELPEGFNIIITYTIDRVIAYVIQHGSYRFKIPTDKNSLTTGTTVNNMNAAVISATYRKYWIVYAQLYDIAPYSSLGNTEFVSEICYCFISTSV